MLRVSGKPDEAVALLGRFLSEVPSMLDEKLQRQNANHPTAPIYKRANSLLTRSKRRDEALSWAKLRFVTCDTKSERSVALRPPVEVGMFVDELRLSDET